MFLKSFILFLFIGNSFLSKSVQSECLHSNLVEFSLSPTFFDPSAYYALNETTEFRNFEIKWLIDLMIEYPGLRTKFVQTITKQETIEIAKKRMINFEKSLKQGGVDMNRITFESKVFYVDEAASDQRSRIQGVMISLD